MGHLGRGQLNQVVHSCFASAFHGSIESPTVNMLVCSLFYDLNLYVRCFEILICACSQLSLQGSDRDTCYNANTDTSCIPSTLSILEVFDANVESG